MNDELLAANEHSQGSGAAREGNEQEQQQTDALSSREHNGATKAANKEVEDEDDDDDDDEDDGDNVNIVISDIVNKPYSGGALQQQQQVSTSNTTLTWQKAGGVGFGAGLSVNGGVMKPGMVGMLPGVSASGSSVGGVPGQMTRTVAAKSQIDLEAPGTIGDLPTYEYNLQEVNDEDKPWRKPGADITDYFNYGFNEETWIAYCMKQKRLRVTQNKKKGNFKIFDLIEIYSESERKIRLNINNARTR